MPSQAGDSMGTDAGGDGNRRPACSRRTFVLAAQDAEPVALWSWTENRPQDMGLTDQRFCTCCGRPPRISHSATGSPATCAASTKVRREDRERPGRAGRASRGRRKAGADWASLREVSGRGRGSDRRQVQVRRERLGAVGNLPPPPSPIAHPHSRSSARSARAHG